MPNEHDFDRIEEEYERSFSRRNYELETELEKLKAENRAKLAEQVQILRENDQLFEIQLDGMHLEHLRKMKMIQDDDSGRRQEMENQYQKECGQAEYDFLQEKQKIQREKDENQRKLRTRTEELENKQKSLNEHRVEMQRANRDERLEMQKQFNEEILNRMRENNNLVVANRENERELVREGNQLRLRFITENTNKMRFTNLDGSTTNLLLKHKELFGDELRKIVEIMHIIYMKISIPQFCSELLSGSDHRNRICLKDDLDRFDTNRGNFNSGVQCLRIYMNNNKHFCEEEAIIGIRNQIGKAENILGSTRMFQVLNRIRKAVDTGVISGETTIDDLHDFHEKLNDVLRSFNFEQKNRFMNYMNQL